MAANGRKVLAQVVECRTVLVTPVWQLKQPYSDQTQVKLPLVQKPPCSILRVDFWSLKDSVPKFFRLFHFSSSGCSKMPKDFKLRCLHCWLWYLWQHDLYMYKFNYFTEQQFLNDKLWKGNSRHRWCHFRPKELLNFARDRLFKIKIYSAWQH